MWTSTRAGGVSLMWTEGGGQNFYFLMDVINVWPQTLHCALILAAAHFTIYLFIQQ